MIYTWRSFGPERVAESQSLLEVLRVHFDVCVIGSGPGGMTAAETLAKKGARVLVLEAGSYFLPSDFTQKEEQMYPRLFYEAGGRRTANRAIRVLHGKGVGGSALHNINLCKRIPPEILAEWNLPGLGVDRFHGITGEIERELGVSQILESQVNENNRLFRLGAERLGYRGGLLSHNRVGCAQSGFCELGCRFDAKMNAAKVFLPRLIKQQGTLIADAWVTRLKWSGRKVTQASVQVRDTAQKNIVSEFNVTARHFVLAAGAVESPCLGLRSGLPNPHGQVGAHLHLHPGAAVCGIFDHQVLMWKGIPQSYECTQFLGFAPDQEKRIWLIGGAAHPCGVAGMMPGFGEEHAAMMRRYPHMAAISPMLHDQTEGQVSEGFGGLPKIDYMLGGDDRAQLALGLKEASRILLAAGAQEVIVPFRNAKRYVSQAQLGELDILDHELDLTAVHPMGTLRMGVDPRRSATTPSGQFHGMDNLWVADASLFPTSLGVPPQLSVYTMGRYVGGNLASAL